MVTLSNNFCDSKQQVFKEALIKMYILTIDQMTMCNVKAAICSDRDRELWDPEPCCFSSLSPLSSSLFLVAVVTAA